jgi:phospholipid-transporting ATPase
VNWDYTLEYPIVYRAGQLNAYFNIRVFWRWILFSIWHGGIIYVGTTYGLDGPIDDSGMTYTLWFKSVVAFTCVINVIMAKIWIETVYWSMISAITGLLCILLYYATILLGTTPAVSAIF